MWPEQSSEVRVGMTRTAVSASLVLATSGGLFGSEAHAKQIPRENVFYLLQV